MFNFRKFVWTTCVVFLALALMHGVAQSAIYIGDSSGTLGLVNPVSGSVSLIGNMGQVMTDVAMDSSGQLWGVTFNDLYKVDKTTAASTWIGNLGAASGGSNALAFGPGGTLYLASTTSTSLFTVNTGSGAATSLIGNTGWYSSGDLDSYGGQLYWTTSEGYNGAGNDHLVQIDTGLLTVSDKGFVHLAGGAQLDLVYGLASDSGVLYGVSGTQVYTVSTVDALATPSADYGGNGLGAAYGASESVIPEPATIAIWGLLSLTFGGFGFHFWRRNTRPGVYPSIIRTPWSDESRMAIHQLIERGRNR